MSLLKVNLKMNFIYANFHIRNTKLTHPKSITQKNKIIISWLDTVKYLLNALRNNDEKTRKILSFGQIYLVINWPNII